MSIPLPNLDNRTYADLINEAQALIPDLQASWTNHNASDPGIMLIELFAWLSEMVMYRLNEMTDQHLEVFLELLNGEAWAVEPGTDLNQVVQSTILALRDRYRAVTHEDFEYLVQHKWPLHESAVILKEAGLKAGVERVHCLPRYDLTAGTNPEADGHITVVAMLADQSDQPINSEVIEKLREACQHSPASIAILDANQLAKSGIASEQVANHDLILDKLWQFLDERCLLSVRHHVVTPAYKTISVSGTIYLRDDAPPSTALTQAQATLNRFYDPRSGGNEGAGWPFGRSVFSSELYAILRSVDLINYVEGVTLSTADGEQSQVEIPLRPHELITLDLSGLTAADPLGNLWQFDTDGQLIQREEGAR